jgi:hypothetical protein
LIYPAVILFSSPALDTQTHAILSLSNPKAPALLENGKSCWKNKMHVVESSIDLVVIDLRLRIQIITTSSSCLTN